MVAENSNAVSVFAQNPNPHQPPLHSPRFARENSDRCRLVIDRRLIAALESIDDSMGWMVLPEAVQVRRLAGCLILTAD